MNFLNYYIRFKNWIGEGQDIEIQIQDLSTLEDPPGDTVEIELEGKEIAVLFLFSYDNVKSPTIVASV